MALPARTLVAVADASEAKVMECDGPKKPLKVLKGGKMSHKNLPTRELVTDKRGRAFQSADGSRSAMEHRTDPHTHEKQVFAAEVSEFIRQHAEGYERIVLVAPPKMLGEMRKRLNGSVKHKIFGELDKELINEPIRKLPDLLADVITYG